MGGKQHVRERERLGNYTNGTDVKTLLRIVVSYKEKGTKEVSAFCCGENGLVQARTQTPYFTIPYEDF